MWVVVWNCQVSLSDTDQHAVDNAAVLRKIFVYTDDLELSAKHLKRNYLAYRIFISENHPGISLRQQDIILIPVVFSSACNQFQGEYIR